VVITDGPLPEVASAALKADGLSIIEAKDELQATGDRLGAVGSYGCTIMFRVYKKRSQIAFPKHIIAKTIGPGL
jgi:hypothetical protein